jgi:hypothetical protein
VKRLWAASIVLFLIAPATPAQAAKVVTATATETAIGGTTGVGPPVTATATCPGKTKAVAGGFSTSVPSLPNHWLNVFESEMTSDSRGWRVSGAEFYPAPASDALTAYVFGQKRQGGLFDSNRTPFGLRGLLGGALGTSSGHASACFSKKAKALSGGFAANASAYVTLSRRGGTDVWDMGATRIIDLGDPQAETSLDAFVYCARVPKVRVRSRRVSVAGSGRAVTASPQRCPKGTTALGGGFAAPAPVGGVANAALVYESRRVGRAWIASAVPSGGSIAASFTSFSYCR